jgi:hypothetical protein
MYSNENVWHRHELKIGVLCVWEVDLGLPDGLDQVGVGEVERAGDVHVRETGVEPLLTKVSVGHIVLKGWKGNGWIDRESS